jgi:L-fucose dehydrogenase
MNLNLDQKVIIVTGGTEGIGEGIVKVLAAENAIPVVVGRNESDNLKMLAGIDNKGFQVTAALTDPEECENAVKKVIEKFDRIDGLVNLAAITNRVDLEMGNYHDFISSLNHSLLNYYLITHYSLAYLKKSKGAIVNISFKTMETSHGNASDYTESNGGRNALTREWAVELLPYQIRVNAVVVPKYDIPLHETAIEPFENQQEKLQSITGKNLLGKRMTTAEEIAKMVVFLLSERSSHTTGQIVHLDDGYQFG